MSNDTKYEYPSIHHRLIGYPYRVWIFTIIITPLVCVLWALLFRKTEFDFSALSFLLYLFMLAVLTAMMAPSLFIYMFLFWKIIHSKIPVLLKKSILFVVGVGCVYLTNALLKTAFLNDIFSSNGLNVDFITFCFVFFTLSLLFRLN